MIDKDFELGKEPSFLSLNISPPQDVGGYLITGKGSKNCGIRFNFCKKPNKLNRFFCSLLLGWVWEDNTPKY